MNMDVKSVIQALSREELELKFINMFNEYSIIKRGEKQTSDETVDVDFTDFKTRRRQQYLHKTYTSNTPVLNGILKLAVENDDKNLLTYLSQLNAELEAKAKENNDLQK